MRPFSLIHTMGVNSPVSPNDSGNSVSKAILILEWKDFQGIEESRQKDVLQIFTKIFHFVNLFC